jgi:hypothetical protein
MNLLETYPEILTVEQVANILNVSVGTVYGLHGLRKIRIGEGRGIIRILKTVLIDYINSRAQREVNVDASQKTQRHKEMGLPDLYTWKEVQALRLGYEGRSTKRG